MVALSSLKVGLPDFAALRQGEHETTTTTGMSDREKGSKQRRELISQRQSPGEKAASRGAQWFPVHFFRTLPRPENVCHHCGWHLGKEGSEFN